MSNKNCARMDSTPSRLRVQLVDSWKKKKNLRGIPPERKNAKALEGCKNEPRITEPVKVNNARGKCSLK